MIAFAAGFYLGPALLTGLQAYDWSRTQPVSQAGRVLGSLLAGATWPVLAFNILRGQLNRAAPARGPWDG